MKGTALEKREIAPSRRAVEPIGLTPDLQQPFVVTNAEAPVRQRFEKSLVAKMLYDLVHERQARCRHMYRERAEVGDHLALRPALAGVLRREQGADDTPRFGGAQIRASSLVDADRLMPRTLDEEGTGDFEAAVAREVKPT